MEYVPGQTLQELDLNANTDIIPRLAKVVEHLGQSRTDKYQVP
jgi:hypothetical protein